MISPGMRRAVVLALLVAAPVAQAHTWSSGRIVRSLNAERTRLGMLPAKESRSWSRGCARHDHWMTVNRTIGHHETKGSRAYTRSGAWAGAHSVLSYGLRWRGGNPWRDSPMHLSLLLSPRLATTGADESGRYECLVTAGIDYGRYAAQPGAPLADHVFTYPEDGGRAPHAQLALETPFTPQQKVGISGRHVTGPYLIVFAITDTPPGGATVASDHAGLDRLVGGGIVATATGKRVRTEAIDRQLHGEIPIGAGFLLPVDPLRKHTRYTATAVVAAPDGREVTHTWSFTTTARRLKY
jgi:hypothetical protein